MNIMIMIANLWKKNKEIESNLPLFETQPVVSVSIKSPGKFLRQKP